MPELPEVETIARGVNLRVRGDRIVEVWFWRKARTLQNASGAPGQRAGGKRSILEVHRTGKHIVCELGAAEESVQSHPGRKNKARRGWGTRLV
jgi:formamidopyrimidine-DNA glycosylase